MQPNDTKKKLEIKALQFFAQHDFERSSLNDIAKALGVTKGAIYHYFTGKDDLFHASVIRLMEMMAGYFVDVFPRDVPLKVMLDNLFNMDGALEQMGEASGLGDFITAYQNSFYLFLAALKKFPDLQELLDDIYTGFRGALEECMTAAIERGEIREDTDIEAVAYEITAFYEGALLLGAFTKKKDYTVLGPRVWQAIWQRITVPT